MAVTKRRYYQEVPANTTLVDEFVPASGNYHLSLMGGNGDITALTSVCVVWDYQGAGEDILMVTHGDTRQPVDIDLTADGVKKLAIVLKNDNAAATVLGGYWTGSD